MSKSWKKLEGPLRPREGSPSSRESREKKNPRSRSLLQASHGEQAPAQGRAGSPAEEPSRVGLIEAQPFSVMAYWEAAPRALAAARRRVGDPDSNLVLRFQEVSFAQGETGGASFDVRVEGGRGNHFLKVGSPHRRIRCELGVLSTGGRFASLARSNVAQTPRPEESDRYEESFRVVTGWGARPPERPLEKAPGPLGRQTFPPAPVPAGAAPGAPAPAPGAPAREGAASQRPGEAPWPGPAPPAPPWPVPAPQEPPWPVTAGAVTSHLRERTEGRDPSPAARGGILERPRDLGAERPFYAEMVDLRVEPRPAGAAVEFPAPPPGPGAARDGSGAPEVLEIPLPRGEVVSGIELSLPSSFGGASSGTPSRAEEQVDLEVHADVVIYGRTRPGTKVLVSGIPVPVRGDGSFEARFALPPGTSGQGEARSAAGGGR